MHRLPRVRSSSLSASLPLRSRSSSALRGPLAASSSAHACMVNHIEVMYLLVCVCGGGGGCTPIETEKRG